MKKKHFKATAFVLSFALLQFSFSPFVFMAHAKVQVVISGEAGKAQVSVNGKTFPLKTALQVKDGVHVIRLKKDVFTSLGVGYSEWDMKGSVFVGLKYGGHAVILEIQHGRREIKVRLDGESVSVTPAPALEGSNVFVPLEPLFAYLGFSVAGAPEKIVQKQKPVTVLTPKLPLEPARAPNVKKVKEVKAQLLPASGNIKKLTQDGKAAITLAQGTGAKAGEILYIARDKKPVAAVKVMKAGDGWCVAKILSVEKGQQVRPGDGVSVTKQEIAKIPVQPVVAPVETKPEITKQPEVPAAPVETKEPEKAATVPIATEEPKKELGKKPEEKKQTLDDMLKELQGKKPETEAKPLAEKKILAVMGFENLSKVADVTLARKALDSVTEALHNTQRFTLVERDKIGAAILELHFGQTEFLKPDDAKKLGELLGADWVGAGSVKSVSQAGKTGAMVELSMRIFETETGKLLYSVSAVGKSEGEGNADYHTGQAINRAGMFMAQKIPVDIGKMTGDSAEVSFGVENGVRMNLELPVLREGKEIGKLVIKTVHPKSSSGVFVSYSKGVMLKDGDQVINPYDDTPPKTKKGGLGGSTLLIGVLAVGLLAAMAGGGGKKDSGGGGSTNVPPGPPD